MPCIRKCATLEARQLREWFWLGALLGRTKDKYGQGVRGPSAPMPIFQLDRQIFKRAHEPLTRFAVNIAKQPELSSSWLAASRRVSCRAMLGSVGELIVLVRELEHHFLCFGVFYLVGEHAHWCGPVAPMLRVIQALEWHGLRSTVAE
jgi:hypothetical protein